MSNPIKFDTILHKFFDTFDSFVNFDQKKKIKSEQIPVITNSCITYNYV